MSTKIFNYYILKESNKFIDAKISTEVENVDVFKHALFLSVDDYYTFFSPFKINKYNINKNTINPKYFKDYLITALDNADNPNKFYLCYMLLANYFINKHINEYITYISSNMPYKYEQITKTIDMYYFEKNENKSLSKINILKYYNSDLNLSLDQTELFELPTKKVLGFFCYNNYNNKCYKNLKKYFKNHTKNNIFRNIFYFFYDFINLRKGNLKTKHLPYKKYTIKYLNLTNEIYNNNETYYNHSINDVYNNILI